MLYAFNAVFVGQYISQDSLYLSAVYVRPGDSICFFFFVFIYSNCVCFVNETVIKNF